MMDEIEASVNASIGAILEDGGTVFVRPLAIYDETRTRQQMLYGNLMPIVTKYREPFFLGQPQFPANSPDLE